MDDWYASATGACALRAQQDLLRRCLAPRRRTGRSLLEVHCGEGRFLPLLMECGFDVTAADPRPECRAAAAALEPRAEIVAAAGDCLPFADDAFDHVLLHLATDAPEALDAALHEAFRVAVAGLAVTFWNALSVPSLLHRLRGRRPPWPGPLCSWWRVWRGLRALRGGRISAASIFACPEHFWNAGDAASSSSARLWAPVGAWCVLLLDMSPSRPVTPLPLRLERRSLGSPAPAMEYGECGHKTQANAANSEPTAP